jgi:hypothetical protein
VGLAVFVANELAVRVSGEEDAAASLEPGVGEREPGQQHETTEHT